MSQQHINNEGLSMTTTTAISIIVTNTNQTNTTMGDISIVVSLCRFQCDEGSPHHVMFLPDHHNASSTIAYQQSPTPTLS